MWSVVFIKETSWLQIKWVYISDSIKIPTICSPELLQKIWPYDISSLWADIYIYIYIYIYMCVYVLIYMYVLMDVCMCIYVNIHIFLPFCERNVKEKHLHFRR